MFEIFENEVNDMVATAKEEAKNKAESLNQTIIELDKLKVFHE